ncbi:WD40 repeat domain-containing protein [Novipirellula artificiosorum]|uniref:WD domain, G-beta repeat n=1 Tax=Novipirellula artificiosorum TaxID=2528016 RepID=A0A5C6DDG9_9BACT|nr:WD40 repeat domain-containing protein [Novipirellula artificiosorum]TWU33266.1 WD domain, G-beta repeat [Novipirellula artificiosorum]
MFQESLRSLIGFLTLAALTGCQRPQDLPPVAAEPKSSSIDSPMWVDLGTAAPVAMAVRPDGRQVIVSAPPVTHAYALPSGKRIHTWPRQVLAFYSGDGKTVLTVSDSVTSVSDTQSFRPLQSFPSPWPNQTNERPPFAAAISHDGSRIAVTDLSQATSYHSPSVIRVFDCTNGTESLSIFVPEKAKVQSIEFLLDATRLLVQYTGSSDPLYNGTRELWDLQHSEVLVEFARAAKVIASKSRKRIAVGKIDQPTKITIHDAGTGRLQNEFHHPDLLRDFCFRPDSNQILIASEVPRSKAAPDEASDSPPSKNPIGRITQWDIASSRITFEQTDDEFPFAKAMYDAEGDRIFGALEKPTGLDEDVDFYLLGWDATTSTSITTLPQAFFSYRIGDVVFLPGSDQVVALQEPFSLRNVNTGEAITPLGRYRVAQTHVQFKANEPSIYSGSSLTDLRSGLSSSSRIGPADQFVQNGKTLFSSRHPSLSLFDVKSGKPFWDLYLECSPYAARSTEITKDARSIVRSQPTSDNTIDDARVLIIQPEAPDSPRILHRYAAAIAIHPSDKQFAAASDQSIEEFDIASAGLLGRIGEVPGRVLDMAYTADGSQIAACGVIDHRNPQTRTSKSSFGWAWLYDRETHQVQPLIGHTAVVTSLAIDSPRHRLATSSNDGTVRLWNMETGECLWVYKGHHSQIDCVDISSDGKLMASAGVDGIAIWNIAGVVDPDIQPAQLASEFTSAQKTETTNETPGKAASSTPPPSPAQGTAQWDVVKVGDTSRVHFHNASVDPWLQQNRNAHQALRRREVPRRPNGVPSAYSGPSSQSSNGERLLFTKFAKPFVKVFDSNYEEVQSWPIRASGQTAVISPDGDCVFIVRDVEGHSTGKIHVDIYDVESGERLGKIQDIDARWGTAIDMDPLGRTLLLRVDNNSIDLREIATGKSLGQLRSTPAGAGRSAQYSPDGRLIAMGKYPDTEISLCDPLTLEPIQTIVNDLPVRWFIFTPDGKRILAGQPYAQSRTWLTMWEIDDAESTSVRRLWSHAGPAGDNGFFSDDGRRYLSPANWNLWTLWDTDNGHVDVAILTSLTNSKDQFALSADGQSIHFYASDGPQVWPPP